MLQEGVLTETVTVATLIACNGYYAHYTIAQHRRDHKPAALQMV